MDLRGLCGHSLLSDYRGNRFLDAAHQVTRMPPGMYLHWLLGRGTNAACLSCCFAHSSKVRRRFEIRSSVPGFSASNPKEPRKVQARRREGQRVKRIGDINERTCLLTFCGLRKQRESQARPPGGSRAPQFHQRPARKAPTEHGIELLDSARLEFDDGTSLESFEPASNEG